MVSPSAHTPLHEEDHALRYNGWLLPNPPSLVGQSSEEDVRENGMPDWIRKYSKYFRLVDVSESEVQVKTAVEKKARANSAVDVEQKDVVHLPILNTINTKKCSIQPLHAPDGATSTIGDQVPISNEATLHRGRTTSFQPSFSQRRYTQLQKNPSDMSTRYFEKEQFIASGILCVRHADKDGANTTKTEDDDSATTMSEDFDEFDDQDEWTYDEGLNNNERKRVRFDHCLVSSVNIIPKTRPEEVSSLFFRMEDLRNWENDRRSTLDGSVEVVHTGDQIGSVKDSLVLEKWS